jgi:hypothetical protein
MNGGGDEPISLTARRMAKEQREAPTTHALLISFEARGAECVTDGCRDFVLGYEAGRLDARLTARPESWDGTYHTVNLDMLLRVAEAHGYVCSVERSADPAWVHLAFVPAPRPRLALLPPEEP